MALNSLNTNIAAYYAQSSMGMASETAASSISRLSSGDRIVRASDDVAAMSAGTSLLTNVVTLKMALVNTAQGSSMLQVADGALSQVTDILQRQKALAVQAGGGSLTEAERGFLNQEFQNLTEEIDRLSEETTFNGVTLLDGAVFDNTAISTDVELAKQARGAITFNTNVASDDEVILNGVTFTATTVASGATEFEIGNSIGETVENLTNLLSISTNNAISQATYEASGNSIIITSRLGGVVGEKYQIDEDNTGVFVAEGRSLDVAFLYALQGSNQEGFTAGSMDVQGTVGDAIVNTLNYRRSEVELTFGTQTSSTALNAAFTGNSIQVDEGDGVGTINFSFTATAGSFAVTDQVTTGATLEETLDNFVSKYNEFGFQTESQHSNDYGLRQTEARRDGRSVIITSIAAGNVMQADLTTTYNITQNGFAAGVVSISNGGNFNNGATTGVDVTGVANGAFFGTVQGFQVDYTGTTNSVNIALEVGDHTYRAASVNAAFDFTGAASVRMISDKGDYFDFELMGATNNVRIEDQNDADVLAGRLDRAFAGLTFYQGRDIDSFNATGDILTDGNITGSLTGSSMSLQNDDFSDLDVSDVRVRSPLEGSDDGSIEFDINGVTYRSSGDIGSQIGANSITVFTSLKDGNDTLTFRNGDTDILFGTDAEAENLEAAFIEAFESGGSSGSSAGGGGSSGSSSGSGGVGFQVGVTTSDTLEISIGEITSAAIFDGLELDVSTAESAAIANEQLDLAIDAVTSVRAEVGALQSRFSFAAQNIQSSIQSQDAARGELLDTDVAAESTAYATAQVQLQAGVAVLAQANQIPENLLQLLG